MQFFGAIRKVLIGLHKELPSTLFYHDVDHVKDVYRMTRHIGRNEGLNEHQLKLALTAAILHDSGFTIGTDIHEIRSCEIARKILPLYDYTPEDIQEIEGMIMATTIPHNPQTLSEQVICDADLDYLGRVDFAERAEKLFQELKLQGIVTDRDRWNTIQVSFLKQHRYFTNTAIEARQSMKDQHLLEIKREIDKTQN
jgi:uncharacterized protein